MRYDNGDSLGATGTHPLYSLDRQQFIPTEDIKVGEHLLSKSGIITVVTKRYDPTPQEVYNLEVGQWHNFLVGVSGVVVHNGPCKVEVFSQNGTKIGDLVFEETSGHLVFEVENFIFGGTHSVGFSNIASGSKYPFTMGKNLIALDINLTEIAPLLKAQENLLGKAGFGGKIFDQSIAHFESKLVGQGKKLDGIYSQWEKNNAAYGASGISDNLKTYNEAVNSQLLNGATTVDHAAAALKTPTGKWAELNGFSKVSFPNGVEPVNNTLTVLFLK